jgi:hypothetical protein
MNQQIDNLQSPTCYGPGKNLKGCVFILLVMWNLVLGFSVQGQTSYIVDAWWSYQQDCNGDGCWAGTIPGNLARLNWEPDVTNCNGTLTVYEKIYTRACGTIPWSPVFTNAPHNVTGCSTLNLQHLDLPLSAGCACRDYKIEVYRNGQVNPDYTRSSTNDASLSQHREQLLSEDYCQSDTFASCTYLGGAAGSQADSNQNATKEPGEPDHAGNPGGHSLWYCWTAATNRPVTFSTAGSTFDTLLAVYTGNTVSTLTLVASNDDIAGATNRLSSLTFTPVTGATYHIAVDGYGDAAGIIVLNWNQTGSALADLIFWAPAVSPSIATTTFTTNSCEVLEGCVVPGTRRLLRFNTETRNIGLGDLYLGNPQTNALFTYASCHGHYHFEQFAQYDLLDTNSNVVAAGHKVGFCLEDVQAWRTTPPAPPVRYNCGNQGIQSGWADIYSSGLPCQYIDITGVPAGDYSLRLTVTPDSVLVEERYDNNTILVPVNLPPTNCVSPPANDAFANAIPVTGQPFTISEFNNCATRETGEPLHVGNSGGHSVWFNWTPAVSQTANINTKGSDFDTLLAVYTGSSVNALTVVASNDDIIPGYLQSQVSFAAVGGTTYRIAVDGYGGAVGTVVLNISPPGNDDFANAYLIAGSSGTTNGLNYGATKEPNEPAHAYDVGGHSLWYRWVAPATGPVDFNTAGSDFNTTLAVYTGTALTSLVTAAANDDDPEQGGLSSSRLWFYAVSGTTYRIAVDGFGGDIGNVKLSWNMDSRLQTTQLADGTVRVTLTGIDWQRYTLLGSSDLSTWNTNAPTITLSRGSHSFTNNPGTNVPNRQFYRAQRAP